MGIENRDTVALCLVTAVSCGSHNKESLRKTAFQVGWSRHARKSEPGKNMPSLLFTVINCRRSGWVRYVPKNWQAMNVWRLEFLTSIPTFIRRHKSRHFIPSVCLELVHVVDTFYLTYRLQHGAKDDYSVLCVHNIRWQHQRYCTLNIKMTQSCRICKYISIYFSFFKVFLKRPASLWLSKMLRSYVGLFIYFFNFH